MNLKKFAVVYMGDINAKNGASKVVKSFNDNKELFLHHNLTLTDVYSSRSNTKGLVNGERVTIKNRVNKLIKKILKKTSVGNYLSFKLQYLNNALISVNKFMKSDDKVDLVLFHDMFSSYLYLSKNKNKFIKTITVIHSDGENLKMIYEQFPYLKASKWNNLLRKIEETVYERSDLIVFVSRTSKQTFLEKYPKLSSKTYYVYNGIPDLERKKSYNYKDLRLISVGTLNSRKSQDLIINSVARINNKDIKIDLVGDGDQMAYLKSLAKEKGLQKNVKFWGQLNNVDEVLENSSLFILTSKDEGLPIAIIEAMRLGLPIISTDVGGISELIDDNGVLVDYDIDSITTALQYVIDNMEILPEWSINSRELFLSKFNIKSMVLGYSELINGELNEIN